jgi:4-amino-4-deoxy-L-arabinose transferase-like glycosyltransferase
MSVHGQFSPAKEASFSDLDNARAAILSGKTLGAATVVVSLLGAFILLICTRWGIGLYPDSIVYVGAARSILEGDGFRFLDDVGQFSPVIQYPPLYSYSIAAFALMGMDALEGARWISVLLFAANAVLMANIAYRCTASYGAALIACFFAMTAFPLVYIHSQALTEPMFIFLIFLAFSVLARYLEHPRLGLLCAASLIIGLSCLVRYVGVAFIFTGAMVVLCLSNTSWKQRLAHSALFSALASFLFIAWVGRNLWSADNAVNRTFAFHLPPFSGVLQATDTIGYWFFPSGIDDGTPWVARFGVLLIFSFLCWLVVKVRFRRSRYIQMISVCAVGYCTFLLISWCVNEQPLYLDTRTLALLFLALMILTVSIITEWFRAARPATKSWRWFALDCVLIFISLMQMINGAVWLRHSYLEGIGLAVERWRNSELLNLVKNNKTPDLIFSNAPDFIYTLTGKRAALIPRKVIPHKSLKNNAPNQQYAAEIAIMKEQLENKRGVLVYFDDGDDRLWYLPSKTELEARLPLQVLKTASDGTVYGLNHRANQGTLK